MGIPGEVLPLTPTFSRAQVMAYSSHSAQSNGFLPPAGKGAAPTAHRGVSAPERCIPSQISWNYFVSPGWEKAGVRQQPGLGSAVLFWADQRPAAGAGCPAQPQEQLQRARPAAPHHRQPGAGHCQPHGAPAPPGDAQEAGQEGKNSPELLVLPLTPHTECKVTLCP